MLIELMVMIVISGILGAITKPDVKSYMRQISGVKPTAKTEMIYEATVLLDTDTNQWPRH